MPELIWLPDLWNAPYRGAKTNFPALSTQAPNGTWHVEQTIASYLMLTRPDKTPALHARNCLNYLTNIINWVEFEVINRHLPTRNNLKIIIDYRQRNEILTDNRQMDPLPNSDPHITKRYNSSACTIIKVLSPRVHKNPLISEPAQNIMVLAFGQGWSNFLRKPPVLKHVE